MKLKCVRCKEWFRTATVEGVCSKCAEKYHLKRSQDDKNRKVQSVSHPVISNPPTENIETIDWANIFILGHVIHDSFYTDI